MILTRSRTKSLGRGDDVLNDTFPPAPQRPTPPGGVHDESHASASAPAPSSAVNMSFSDENVTSIIASLQRSQTEAFKELLDSVIRNSSSTPVTSFISSTEGTLTRCKATFSGRRDESVEAFIDAVDAFSECAHVTDSSILRGLAFLFKEDAATWWQGIKSTISSWTQAKDNLLNAYGDRRPPHRIYLEIFATSQQKENTDIFVARIRVLMSKIPIEDLSDKARLDMTYGLLHKRIRQRLRREDFSSFSELLRHARNIEDSFDEGERTSTGDRRSHGLSTAVNTYNRSTSTTDTRAQTRAPFADTARASPSVGAVRSSLAGDGSDTVVQRPPPTQQTPPTQPPATAGGTVKRQRPSCVYCKRFGHTKDQCRKLLNQGEPALLTNSNEMRGSDKSEQSFYSVESQSCSFNASKHKDTTNICNHCGLNFTYNACNISNSKCSCINNEACVTKGVQITNNTNERCSRACETTCLLGDNNYCKLTDIDNPMTLKKHIQGAFSKQNIIQGVFHNFCEMSEKHVYNNNIDYQPWQRVQERVKSEKINFSHTHGLNPTKVIDVADDSFLETTNRSPSANNQNNVSYSINNLTCDDMFNDTNLTDVKVANSKFSRNKNVYNNISDDNCFCSRDDYTRGTDLVGPPNSRGSRPIFNIQILGFKGTALIDTAAKHCIAGHTLYALLLRQGHALCSSSRDVKLADGVVRNMEVLTTTLEVWLKHKVIKIPFLIFPDATNNETLLGIDFITASGVVIDFHKEKWYFSDSDSGEYTLYFEPTSRSVSCVSAADVLREDEGTHLKPAERQELAEILTRHAHVFIAGGGPTPFAEHRIETGEHPPISVPPYRLNPSKKEVMKAEIDKMLKDDIIEECESAWSSPALMVPKSNGGIRFCVDYRRVNAVTKSDTYPMPRIDDLLQSTKRDCYMSTLDLRSSYWQVAVREADRDKTAFVCPLGTFRFKRMPFGMKNAPATFQRLIDRLRSCSALQDVTILGYLDDLLIISQGYQRHLQDLDAVFKRLAEFNLHVNREKCAFARESVKYLGHVITQEGVATDPEKVSAVLEMKEPSTLKHLRTFLQTCSWFRKFIPNFSKVAEPLTRLTRKNQIWIWGSQQTQAFTELKRLLTTAPILVQADFSRPFVLRTDASNYALGAVLLQGDGNQERPIEYASRLLNAAERNYSTTEREALAVVWAVERFRPYLDGQPVIIGSDHQPLRWLLSLKSPAGRLVRWALKLQSFDIQFQYTPGKANVVADTLSRPICSSESQEDCGICSVICDLPAKSPSQLRQEQVSDPEVEKIVKELEGPEEVAAQRWLQRGFLMDQGVLFRYNPDSESESPQLVIPASHVEEILKELHDSSTAGHPGVDRTYQKVAQLYYFTGMRRIITDYVKACIHCQRYKATNAKPPGLLQTPVMNQRNEVLAIDLFGPLPAGDQGERWVLLVEDTATRWTELFPLKEATAEVCARVLIEEYFLRFGLPRRIISDNGVQFVSAVMRQCMTVLGIKQNLVPLYHPEANPAERKNRDLKAMLAHLVADDHTSWPKMLPVIRFALNSANCRTTGKSPAFLAFGREMRSPTEIVHDHRAILNKDNFVPQITPYLRQFLKSLSAVRERVEIQQDKTKQYADSSRRPAETFKVGDLVLLKSHLLSNAVKDVTAKFFPRRDGPYRVTEQVSPTTYTIASIEQPDIVLGRYHTQDLTRYQGSESTPPKSIIPKRNRGRPANAVGLLVQERGRSPGLEGEYIANRTQQISTRFPIRESRGMLPARFRK